MSEVQLCQTAGDVLNTGANTQCIEGKLKHIALAKKGFSFNSVADALDNSVWGEAIRDKNIVPLYSLYEVANADKEATYYEVDEFKFKTNKEVKVTTFESYLGLCSHKALKSLQDSDYTQVFEITEDGAIIGVMDGEAVKGQDISNFDVSIRKRTTKDKPAFTLVTITYKDYTELENNPFARIPDWDANDLQGIFDVTLTFVSATSSSIVVDITTGCNNVEVVGLLLSDFTYSGGTLSGMTSVGNRYTFAGTGLTSGNLKTDGVASVGDVLYESNTLAVTI